jgi:hypothetical protein
MEPNKAVQDSYSYFNMRTGISNDDMTLELYLDNVTDKRADISNTFVFDRARVAIIKPRTIGVRYKKNF